MRVITWVFISLCNLCYLASFAQETIEIYDSKQFNIDAHALMGEEKLLEAEKSFAKIHESDSLYVEALYNRALCLRFEGQIDQALQLIEEGISLNEEYVPDFYASKAICLDSLGRQEEAIELIEAAQNLFPYNIDLKLNKGKLYSSLKQYDKAIEIAKECIMDEPLRRVHHLRLANLFYLSKGLTHAVLPLTAAIALDPENESNLSLIQLSNTFLSSKSEIEEPLFDIDEYEESFEDVDELISNYIALSDKYKIPGKVSNRYLKQLHLVLSESELDQDGFFTNVYLKSFKPIIDNDQFDLFAGLLLLISERSIDRKFIDKNMDEIITLYNQLYETFEAFGENKPAPDGFVEDEVEYIYDDDLKLSIITTYDKAKDILTGSTMYINTEGSIGSFGLIDKDGKRQGPWKWYYPMGELSRTASYVDDNLVGKLNNYYKDGKLNAVYNLKDGDLHGVSEFYKLIGYKYEESDYVNGVKEGETRNYYPDGSISATSQMSADKKEGAFIGYYEDGTIRTKANYKNDLLDGEFVLYYRDGTIDYKENYKEGVIQGPFVSIYKNGETFTSGELKDGKKIGEWKTYNRDGTLNEVETYDLNGKRNGLIKSYGDDDKLLSESEYKNGDLIVFRNYDEAGNVKSEHKKRKNIMAFESTRFNGSVISKGQFLEGLRTGKWKYEDPYGNLYVEEQNEAGKVEGERTTYFTDGSIYSKANYKGDVLNGSYVEYYSNGNVSVQTNYKEGNYHGRYVSYYINGSIYSDLFYNNGVQDGTNTYHNPDGTMYLKEKFDLGFILSKERFNHVQEPKGYWESKGGSGKEEYTFGPGRGTMGVINYAGGDYNGESLRFHVNGNKRSDANYVNGLINGKSITYDIDENIISDYNYYFGENHGEFKVYYPSGKLKQITNYEYGKINGEGLGYYENGQLEERFMYNYGDLKEMKKYSPTGDLVICLNYSNGYFTSYSYESSDKKLENEVALEKGSGTVEAFYSNGNKSISYTLKNGSLAGEFLQYYSDGSLFKKRNYNMGYITGEDISYYPNGNKKSVQKYLDDIEIDTHYFYYEDGSVEHEESYLAGEKHGDAIYYNKDGSVKRILKYHGDVIYEVE